MKKLKEVKKEMYDNIKDRSNWFLSEEERYIVENLKSCIYQDNELPTIYTEEQAFDIVCQWLDWIDATDLENAFWESWYIRWYEVALHELMNHFKAINISWEINNIEYTSKVFTSNKLEEMLNNLLTK